jgi:hypothetical protein
MRIVSVNSAASTVARQRANEVCDSAAPEALGRALIAIEAPLRTEHSRRPARHPSAPFVAHLLATRMQAPQTRERRRAEPEEAIAVYRSMTKPVLEKRVFGVRV